MLKLNKGFTLIELMVVIAIIAILATAGMASYRLISARSRDARRKTDLEQIRGALELYKANNGAYPDQVANYLIPGNSDGCGTVTSILTDYIDEIPCDPNSKTGALIIYRYLCTSIVGGSCLKYQLGANMETEENAKCNADADYIATLDKTDKLYCVNNP